MTSVPVRRPDGTSAGSVELDAALFGVEPNVPLLHQVITAQLAAARSGTQSTLTRAEVRGGGAKPWRQKGTGRARQGSSRAPHWAGGGVTHAPKPRSYKQKTPKKMVQQALRSALSDRAAGDRIAVVESWSFTAPRTKEAKAALNALGVSGKVLVVLGPDDDMAVKSFRNLPEVHLLPGTDLNAYDVLCADWIVFTSATLPKSPPNAKPSRATAARGEVVTEGEATALPSAGEGQVPAEPKAGPGPSAPSQAEGASE